MAVTVGHATTGTATTGTTVTISFTPEASTKGLYVAAGYLDAADTVSTVTWNGSENFTAIFDTGPNASLAIAGFLLLNPTITTADVVVTWTGTIASGAGAGVQSLLGLNTTGGIAGAYRTIYSATGASTTPTITVTDSQSGDLVQDTVVCVKNVFTVDGSQVDHIHDDSIAGGSRSYGASTESAVGGNTVMSWLIADAQSWVIRGWAWVAGDSTPITGLGRRLKGFTYSQGG